MGIEEQASRLEEWMAHGYGRPYQVELRLTRRCNLKCRFCGEAVSTYDHEAEMDKELLLRAVHDAAELGVQRWTLMGQGEAGCRLEDALAVMREVKESGIRGDMITNGTLLTSGAIKEIVEMGWDHINISLDGPNAEVNDYLRGVPGGFDKVMDAIKRFNEAKSESRVLKPTLALQTVMNSRNYDTLGDMVSLAAQNNVQGINFQPVICHEGTDQGLALSDSQSRGLKAGLPRMMREAEKLGVSTNLSYYLDAPLIENPRSMQKVLLEEGESGHRSQGFFCYAPWYLIAIRPDGRVDPCWDVRGHAENSLRDASLKELWTGPYFTGFRDRIARGEMFRECGTCCACSVIENLKLRERLRRGVRVNKKGEMGSAFKPPGKETLPRLGMLRRIVERLRTPRLAGTRTGSPLSPFVLDEPSAHSLLGGLERPLVVATFDGREDYNHSLAMSSPGLISLEHQMLTRPPAAVEACQRLRFDIPSAMHYGELFVKVLGRASDWKGRRVFNLWYRASGEGGRLTVIFRDTAGRRWFFSHGGILTGGSWRLLRVPLEEFHCPDSPRRGIGPDLRNVVEVCFQVSPGQGAVRCEGWMDLYQAFVSGEAGGGYHSDGPQ